VPEGLTAPTAPKKSPVLLLVGLLLAAGLAVQAYFMVKGSVVKSLDFHFVNQVVPNGRDADGYMCCSHALSVDHQGNVYVLEEDLAGGRLQKFSPTGTHLATYHPRNAQEKLTAGADLAHDSHDNVYVLEQYSKLIKVLSPQLKFLRVIPGPSANVTGLAITSKDQILVASGGESLVYRLDTDGKVLGRLDGGQLRMHVPYRLALGSKDELFVLDFTRGMGAAPDVESYGPDGAPVARWQVKNLLASPYVTLGWHPAGYVLVNDNRGDSMARGFTAFDPSGKLLGSGATTDNGIQIANLSCFKVDSRSGDIYVNDNFVNRGLDRLSLPPAGVPVAK
jgi:hypothetical protein